MMKKILLLITLSQFLFLDAESQCLAAIPSGAGIVNSTQTNNGGFQPLWVCSGDTLHSDGGIRNIYLESGSVMTTGGGIDTIYVKNGAHLIMNGGIHVIYYVNIADLFIGGGIPTYVHCNSMFFLYQNAPPGGCFASCSMTVSITPASPITLCSGQSAVLNSTVINGGGNLSYLWTGGQTTSSITVSAAGTDTLIVTDSLGCTAFATATVTLGSAVLNPTITPSGATDFCAGDSVTLDAGSGYSAYAWSGGESTQRITVHSSGNYSVNITDTSGCVGSSLPATITVYPSPAVTILPGSATVCQGSAITFQAGGAVTYLWQPGGQSGNTMTINPVNPIQIQVTGTDSNGCNSSDTATVSVFPLPNVVINPGSVSVCKDSSATFLASGANTYLWQPGSVSGNPFTLTAPSSTQIIVTGIDSNSCSASDTASLTVFQAAAVPVISQSGNMLTANPSGTSYQWYLNGTLIPGATSQNYSTTQAGNYTVVETDSNGCISSASAAFLFTEISGPIKADVQMYPNPAKEKLFVDLGTDFHDRVFFEIRDLNGKTCFAQELTSTLSEIKLQGISSGVYLVIIDGKSGKKLIVR